MISVAVVVATGTITADDLPEHVRAARAPARSEATTPLSTRSRLDEQRSAPLNLREIKEWAGREAQKRVILELQGRTNITRQDLAKLLGVDAKTLRSRLRDISGEAAVADDASRPKRVRALPS